MTEQYPGEGQTGQRSDAFAESIIPWEEIEAGRFMPRRIRGSFRGRALG
jgi:hypothetical protein